MSVHLTLVELLAIHDRLLTEFGGTEGIRDGGALESALFRPQSGYYDDTVQEAAALFESLVGNHPFVDGNKRVAFAAVDVFLRLNGVTLDVADGVAYDFIIGSLEAGTLHVDAIDSWLRDHISGAGG